MGAMADAIAVFFKRSGLEHHRVDSAFDTPCPDNLILPVQSAMFRTTLCERNSSFVCHIHAGEELQLCVVNVGLKRSTVPVARRPAMMEFFTRLNQGMPVGAFYLGLDSDEITFRNSVDVLAGTLTPFQIAVLVGRSATEIDTYYPGISGTTQDTG